VVFVRINIITAYNGNQLVIREISTFFSPILFPLHSSGNVDVRQASQRSICPPLLRHWTPLHQCGEQSKALEIGTVAMKREKQELTLLALFSDH
jgi:hypothetical protein